METKIAEYRKELNKCFDELKPETMELIAMALNKRGRTIFILGNGGSALTASHMAVDLAKGSQVAGFPPLRVISLTDNVGLITAWANDKSYASVFVEQLKTLMKTGDTVIGISASGNSPNVIEAMDYAKRNGVTIGLSGFGGGVLATLSDIKVVSSSRNYGVIEDFHMSLGHIISQFIKEHRERGESWKQASL